MESNFNNGKWTSQSIVSIPKQAERQSWWTEFAASSDRAAFDAKVAQEQVGIRNGRFGLLAATHDKGISE